MTTPAERIAELEQENARLQEQVMALLTINENLRACLVRSEKAVSRLTREVVGLVGRLP